MEHAQRVHQLAVSALASGSNGGRADHRRVAMNNDSNGSTQNPSTTIPVPSRHPSQPDRAEISIQSGEDFYREIRIDNVLKDEDG
jgi:hypothetical protein